MDIISNIALIFVSVACMLNSRGLHELRKDVRLKGDRLLRESDVIDAFKKAPMHGKVVTPEDIIRGVESYNGGGGIHEM